MEAMYMETKQCKRCHHYIQHYTLKEGRVFSVCCGHCVQGKPKRRLPDAAACQHFVPGEPDTEAFVTKDYLSKKLLQYILDMELLPEIIEKDQ